MQFGATLNEEHLLQYHAVEVLYAFYEHFDVLAWKNLEIFTETR